MMSDLQSFTNPFIEGFLALITNNKIERSKSELAMVGKILSSKKMHFNIVRNILQTSWVTKELVQVKILEQNMILCTFANLEDMDNIMEVAHGQYVAPI